MTAGARVLAATDLSAPAAWAEERAARLAAGMEGSLDLLHVVGTTALLALRRVAVGARVQEAIEHAEAELDRSASRLAAAWGIEVRPRVEPGSAPQAILRQVDLMRPDLLVVGAHGGHFVHGLYGYPVAMIESVVQRRAPNVLVLGKRGRSAVEHWAVGSVTAHLVRSVPCDMLVVPLPARDEQASEQPAAGAV
jgi:nucleotide-binding universal stress UspA family protein